MVSFKGTLNRFIPNTRNGHSLPVAAWGAEPSTVPQFPFDGMVGLGLPALSRSKAPGFSVSVDPATCLQ